MNLNLGLAAADAYFKEGDARNLRDYEQALRKADLSTLQDRVEATRANAQDQTGAARGRIQLRPGELSLATTKNSIAQGQASGELGRQPLIEQTRDAQAHAGLGTANFALQNQPTEQRIALRDLETKDKTSQFDSDNLAQTLAAKARQGQIAEHTQRQMINGILASKIGNNDPQGALQWANSVAKNEGIAQGTNGHVYDNIVRIEPKTDPNMPEGGYMMTGKDANGSPVNIPLSESSLRAAKATMASHKWHGISTGDGGVFVLDEKTGVGKVGLAPNPQLVSARNREHDPAEVKTVKWMVENLPMFANNPEAAWKAMREARSESKPAYIRKYILQNAKSGSSSAELEKEAGAAWDASQRAEAQPTPTRPGSNSPTPGKVTLPPLSAAQYNFLNLNPPQ